MKVIKRNGKEEQMLFDKVTCRIQNLCAQGSHGPALAVQADKVAQKVFASLYDGINTGEIDNLSAEVAVAMMTENPDYEKLATRIVVSNMHKTSPKCFTDAMVINYTNGAVSEYFMKCILSEFDACIKHERDYDFGFFGLKTLQKMYLNVGETPQYLFMRVAVGIHGAEDAECIKRVKETYDLMSKRYFIHATPTLFNAGSPKPQMSSCFLLDMKDDSIDGIYDTMKRCAQISKWSGGIGLAASRVRAKGSKITGTNGASDGIIPMLRVFNATARYVNQGGRRKGSIAVYLEPWHADIMEFLDLRLNQGDEEARCRDLFTALWIPDLFMTAVEDDADWHLMCPKECPDLTEVHGEMFNELYRMYVAQGRFRKVVKARQIWDAILKSQVETGTPYMCYKDACNTKSNQQNLGTIKSSNLCTEIVEYTDADEVAVCNLASLSLPAYVNDGLFDFAKLAEVTKVVTRNLNKVIDKNFYPIPEAEASNKRHRPIAIGVQGLADVFMMLGMSFDEPAARGLNKAIFQTIYTSSLRASCDVAREEGPYETYQGSPASRGIFQPNMWGISDSIDKNLLDDITVYGLRNSLLVGPMPTASTAQILGNNEAFEPYTTNIYLRRTLAGEFVVVNKHLVKDLQALGLWTKPVKDDIIRNGGSIQQLDGVPDDVKSRYRTVWEISQKSIIDMAADRGAYICQSQSLNIFMENPTLAKLSSMHLHGWKQGLKTGMYYLRTRSKAKPQQVTVPVEQQVEACRRDNPEGCLMCSG